jgi:hypothetical protein
MEQQQIGDSHIRALVASFRDRGCTARVDEAGKLHISPRRLLTDAELVIIGANREAICSLVLGEQPPVNCDPVANNSDQRPPHADGNAVASIDGQEFPAHGVQKTMAQGQLALPQANVLEGAVIRLAVIAEQLNSLGVAVEAIRVKTWRPGVTIEELAPWIGTGKLSEKGYPIVCPIHNLICAWMTENTDGGLILTCDQGCTKTEIAAASPILCALSTLGNVGEEIAALSEALSLTRNLLDDLRRDLNPTTSSENVP